MVITRFRLENAGHGRCQVTAGSGTGESAAVVADGAALALGEGAAAGRDAAVAAPGLATKIPPHAWFVVSAIFHYLGPSFAVLLFPAVGVLGVAWFRIASAAVIFAPFTRPWATIAMADRR